MSDCFNTGMEENMEKTKEQLVLEHIAEEMEKIATALGAKYFFGFEFEDGTKV